MSSKLSKKKLQKKAAIVFLLLLFFICFYGYRKVFSPQLARRQTEFETDGELVEVNTITDIERVFAASKSDEGEEAQVNLPVSFTQETQFSGDLSVSGQLKLTGDVLGDNIDLDLGDFGEIRAGSVITDNLVAPNVVYGIQAGEGIAVEGIQNLTVSNTDRGSVQNIFKIFKFGEDSASPANNNDTFEFAAGDNVNLNLDQDDKKLSISAENNDKGSDQRIFKNFEYDGDSASAGSNNDSFEFLAGDDIELSLDSQEKKLTISSTAGSGFSHLWAQSGSTLYYQEGNVGIGTNSPASPLDVVSGQDSIQALKTVSGLDNTQLDQQNEGTWVNQAIGTAAQSFTAGISGRVPYIDISADTLFEASNVTLREGENIDGTILATASSVEDLGSDWQRIFFSSNPTVTAGQQYTLRVDDLGGFFGVMIDSSQGDAYGAGRMYFFDEWKDDDDANFKTYVTTNDALGTYGLFIDSLLENDINYGAYFANNVGIGTSNPSSKLEVGGVLRAQRLGFSDDTDTYIDASSDKLSFTAGGSEKMAIDANGNIGINLTSGQEPEQRIHLDEDDSFSELAIRFQTGSPGTTHWDIGYPDSPSANFRFELDDVYTAFAIDQGSKIGIGIEDPEAEIHIASDWDFDADSTILYDTDSTDWHVAVDDSEDYQFIIGTGQTVGSNGLIAIDASGSVGIGMTDPGRKLFVSGDAGGIGPWNNDSHSSFKENFVDVEVLSGIKQLSIKEWQYRPDHLSADSSRHLSPFAEDFRAQFGLGGSDYQIVALDVAGVALKGVQELAEEVDVKLKSSARIKSEPDQDSSSFNLNSDMTIKVSSSEDGNKEQSKVTIGSKEHDDIFSLDNEGNLRVAGDLSAANLEKNVNKNNFWQILTEEIKDVILKIKELIVSRITVKESLEMGSPSNPTGITIYDMETGEAYCLYVKQGDTISSKGRCNKVFDKDKEVSANDSAVLGQESENEGDSATDSAELSPVLKNEQASATDSAVLIPPIEGEED